MRDWLIKSIGLTNTRRIQLKWSFPPPPKTEMQTLLGPGCGSLNGARSSCGDLPVDLAGNSPSRVLGKTSLRGILLEGLLLNSTEVGVRNCWQLLTTTSAGASH